MQPTTKKSFYEPTPKPFRITYEEQPEPTSMPACHYHNNYELYYLRSGRRYYFIKDRTYLIDAGTVVFLNRYEIHSTETYENEGYDRFLISFADDYIEPLFSSIGAENIASLLGEGEGIVKFPPDRQMIFENLLSGMLCEYQKEEKADEIFLKSSLATLLSLMRMYKSNTQNPIKNDDESKKRISDIVGYINNNYNEDITLDSISSKFYVSPYHFSRSFKRVSGLGFNEYLANVRIKEAKKLLSTTKMTVTDVSIAVGYKSPTNFGRVFLKITGKSPMQYRTASRIEKKNTRI